MDISSSLLGNNRALYEEICKTAKIESMSQAASALSMSGYKSYKDANSIRNRFRSSATRTDFFWQLLDATNTTIEVRRKDDPSRKELLEKIEILENEASLIHSIDLSADTIMDIKEISSALLAFEEIKKALDNLNETSFHKARRFTENNN